MSRIEDLLDFDGVVLEADPPGLVRRVAWNDRWIEIALDGGGGACAVDLDPTPGGRYGQLIEYGRDIDRIRVIAESATALLTDVVEALRRNDIDPDHADEDYLGVLEPERPIVKHTVSASVGGRDVADVLAGLPDIEHIQQLFLNDGESLDLRALSVVPQLRALMVNRAGRVNLWLPDSAEALTLNAHHADLSGIAGHPALWNLTVEGLRLRVEQLAMLPRLARLDASRAEVDDVVALADLDLRVLVLNTEQWTQLHTANRRPKHLAAARCTDGTPPAHTVEWSDWLHG